AYVRELAAERDETAKKFPGLSHNITLLKQFAEATGKIPTAKEIRLALNNRDAKLSLDQFADQLAKLGDRTAAKLDARRDVLRRAAKSIGLTLAQGIEAGIDLGAIAVAN